MIRRAASLARGCMGSRVGCSLTVWSVAACVTMVPGARSVYRWQGTVESAAECLLIIKSSRPLFEPLRMALEKAHAYDVPELLALPVVEGSANYLNWLEGQLGA